MFEFFFSRKKREGKGAVELPLYFDRIGADLHSHLIPGIDDGSTDLMTSLKMIKKMGEMGIRHIATTPHVSEIYPNDPDSILDGLKRLKQLVAYEGVDVQLTAAAEYMINDLFEQKILDGAPLLTLPKNHILVEMPHVSEPMNLQRVLALLNEKGYVPILAHPERYRFYNRDIAYFEKIKGHGCLFQVNALSLVGYYGLSVADTAWMLMDKKLIDFIGTDFHHEHHIEVFKKKMTPACHLALQTYPFKNGQLFSGDN